MNRRKQGRSKAGIVLILILLAAMSFGVGGFLGWLRSKEGFRDEAESIARVRLDEETPQVITNAQDALEVLTEEVKTGHGVNDAEEEYQLYTEMTAGDFRVYWFRQYWQGIAVDGSGFKVVTDADGLLQMINGKHIDAEDADTSFLVSEEQAKELVEEYLKETYQCGEKGAEIEAVQKRILPFWTGLDGHPQKNPAAAWRERAGFIWIGGLLRFLEDRRRNRHPGCG